MTENKSTMGIIMMIMAVAILTGMNVMVKMIGTSYHPTQITFMRSLVAMILIFPFLMKAGGLSLLKTKRPGLHLMRSLAGTLGNILYFYAFQRMTVGDVMVISQAVPLFVTIFAVLFLSERVGIRRWVAVLVGFLGVIIAIDPAGNFHITSLIAVAATGCWASTILFMRKLGATESPYTVTFIFMTVCTTITACIQPWVWQTPTPRMLVLILGIGISGALGQMLMSTALKYAKASVVSPFNYTGIIWAIGFDLVLWDIIPAWTTILGAGIITVTGVYIFHREALVRQKSAS
ncbi:MAG: DMT family transporter [Rhodospirillales bacterium]|nr:DMT family transporter [Rhodospirillales bacterium]